MYPANSAEAPKQRGLETNSASAIIQRPQMEAPKTNRVGCHLKGALLQISSTPLRVFVIKSVLFRMPYWLITDSS